MSKHVLAYGDMDITTLVYYYRLQSKQGIVDPDLMDEVISRLAAYLRVAA